ncbi:MULTISPECIES: hypothetical protein [Streptomyces]|uniref:Uncharacterized protein n=1 Tax=Streptomyces griseosporeus TaxID=1910 RepID=A0ABV3KUK4_STRGS|nr:hypothetical protein [Streptomyces actuosus]
MDHETTQQDDDFDDELDAADFTDEELTADTYMLSTHPGTVSGPA